MPQRTVFIRQADEPLWNSIDRAKLVRDALEAYRHNGIEQPKPTDAERDVVHPTGADNPTNGFNPGAITPAMRATANKRPLPTASNGGSVNDPVPLYNIIITDTSTIVAKNLTRDVAEEKLKADINGEMSIVPA